MYGGVVLATVEIAVVVSLAGYTAMVTVARGGHRGVVFDIVQLGIVAITYDAAGVATARHCTTHGKVVDIGLLGCTGTEHHSEQTSVVGCSCYFKVADGFVVSVEMAFEGGGHCLTYHTPVAERGKIEVVDNFEIQVVEIHTGVYTLCKSIKGVGRTNQIRVGLCTATAAECRYVESPKVFLHPAYSTRNLCGAETIYRAIGTTNTNYTGDTARPAHAVEGNHCEVGCYIVHILIIHKTYRRCREFGAEAVGKAGGDGVQIGCSREISSAGICGHAYQLCCSFGARGIGRCAIKQGSRTHLFVPVVGCCHSTRTSNGGSVGTAFYVVYIEVVGNVCASIAVTAYTAHTSAGTFNISAVEVVADISRRAVITDNTTDITRRRCRSCCNITTVGVVFYITIICITHYTAHVGTCGIQMSVIYTILQVAGTSIKTAADTTQIAGT